MEALLYLIYAYQNNKELLSKGPYRGHDEELISHYRRECLLVSEGWNILQKLNFPFSLNKSDSVAVFSKNQKPKKLSLKITKISIRKRWEEEMYVVKIKNVFVLSNQFIILSGVLTATVSGLGKSNTGQYWWVSSQCYCSWTGTQIFRKRHQQVVSFFLDCVTCFLAIARKGKSRW